ncbi:holin [Citrobacter freundii]|uniref:phage holin n=1 Tax=Citrobacter freundii TaxID=546 RepID=UPI0015EA512A|nr:phage holin [Citrobacter freundii]QMD25888.1 holin [Citrobacter freundii]
MTRMSTIYSRLSYGTGTTLAGCGVSAKAYAETAKTAKTAKEVSWMLADRIAGLSLSDWAIIVGIACTVITCAVNWYYRRKEREDRLNGNVYGTEK